MKVMPIEHIPDWETRLARQDAFWEQEIIDRPVVYISFPKTHPEYTLPESKHATMRDKWLDAEYQANCVVAGIMNTDYMGDSLPSAMPSLGPEIFSAYMGVELEYGNDTSWSIPNLDDWSEVDRIRFSEDNPYFKKTLEITDALLEAGKGKFYTGITDIHPGGDAIAAFRDPAHMNIDMIENPEEIKSLLRYVTDVYFKVYDIFYSKLVSSGQAISSWPAIVSTKKWYVPSNDFSCMISKAMFDEFFLPGIAEECRFMEASIYHLDGPGALRHLDSLLEIPELNAIQWVYGDGQGRASDWMHVYKKCQAAGKGLQIGLEKDEIDYFMENLKPHGTWISISGISSKEEAESVINKFNKWR